MEVNNPHVRQKRKLIREIDKLQNRLRRIDDMRTTKAKDLKSKIQQKQQEYREVRRKSRYFFRQKIDEMMNEA